MIRTIMKQLLIFGIIFLLFGTTTSLCITPADYNKENKTQSFIDYDTINSIDESDYFIENFNHLHVKNQKEFIINNDNKEETNGFIIQLKNKSIYKTKQVLEKQTKQEKKVLDHIQKYKTNLLQQQDKLLHDIERTLNKKINQKILYQSTELFNGIVLDISAADVAKIQHLSDIRNIFPNVKFNACLDSSIPLINADDVWETTDDNGIKITGKNITIAILDTGIDYNHPDLGGGYGKGFKVIGGFDIINNDSDPMDDNGHGTHCAGISAGNGKASNETFVGVAPDANLYAFKVLDADGGGWTHQILDGIQQAVDPNGDTDPSDHVDIISMSLGSPNGIDNDPICQALDNAVQLGVIVTVSAGNHGPYLHSIGSPACARNVITVGASTHLKNSKISGGPDQVTWFSSRGPTINCTLKPDVVAPGGDCNYKDYDNYYEYGIISCRANSTELGDSFNSFYRKGSGTSMSCPHVAGQIALIKQAHPSWSPLEIKMVIRNTAKDIGFTCIEQGYGRIDVFDSIKLNNTPAIAQINSAGNINGLEYNITGTAKGNNFQQFSLFYKKGWDYNSSFQEESWIKLCESSDQINNDIIYRLNIGKMIDGKYTLRLFVKNDAGVSEDRTFINLQNTIISYPKDVRDFSENNMDVFSTWKEIKIRGTCRGMNLDYYTISWSKENENNWKNEGIVLTKNGASQINNDLLGVWNVSTITTPGYYCINLTKYCTNGSFFSYETCIWIDPDYMKGWPLNTGGYFLPDSPVIADIDNDGKNEIILADYYKISVYQFNGKLLSGWPQEINTWYNKTFRGMMMFTPSVGDVDGDGYNELVTYDDAGYVHIYEHDGSYKPGWPKQFVRTLITSVSLADIDNDGCLDICFGDGNGYIHVIDSQGNELKGWPKWILSTQYKPHLPFNPPSIADIDKDGNNEIVISTLSFIGDTKYILIFNHDGTLKKGWPKRLDPVFLLNNFFPSVILADINNDSFVDVIAAETIIEKNVDSSSEENGSVFVWNHDGTMLEGWPRKLTSDQIEDNCFCHGISLQPPVVSDLDSDGYLELLISDEASESMWVLNYDGSLLKNWPITSYSHDSYLLSDTDGLSVTGNLDDDIRPEFVNSLYGYKRHSDGEYLPNLYAFNEDTSIVELFPKKIDGFTNDGHAITDLDGDGDNELVVITYKSPFKSSGMVSIKDLIFNILVWDLEVEKTEKTWSQLLYNACHTSGFPIDEPYVHILSPLKSYINVGKIPLIKTLLKNTVLFGPAKFTIVTGKTTEKIEIMINDELKETLINSPYEWVWDEAEIGRHDVKVIAYGSNGKTAVEQYNMLKLL